MEVAGHCIRAIAPISLGFLLAVVLTPTELIVQLVQQETNELLCVALLVP